MKLIVGLGNPGKIYEQTRHNIGRLAAKELGKRHKVILKRGLFGSSLSAKCRIKNQVCLLAVPVFYMNLSGGAVKSLIKKHKVGLEDLIVVFDDLDLEQGRLKIKSGGSSGGHKGLESIIASLGTGDFCRLRIGIGRPENKFAVRLENNGLASNSQSHKLENNGLASHSQSQISDYVLSGFKKNEKTPIAEAIAKACDAVELWVEAGAQQTMNIINR